MSFTTKPVTASSTGESFLRLDDVLRRIPVSRATWYAGVKSGRYPAQVKLGPRVAAWRCSDIDKLAASFTREGFA
ncbi:AlpA family phage regulatory protein [Achromobacter insolitus]|uniref:helix-turn-helix transcriptional regulator n=1 Tax=Achromobacter insolitus TaxID=217204 RepID=UPI00244EEF4E|nr:AlpA family phage regulatory protein [Achromobacter insolitus]MDH3062324.1 AlpA family phage regulatory protein [Achromobacter insolitus]